MTTILLAIITVGLFVTACWIWWLLLSTRRRYAPILDIDAAVASRKQELSALSESQTHIAKEIQRAKDDDASRHARQELELADAQKKNDEKLRRSTDAFKAEFAAAKSEEDVRRARLDVDLAEAQIKSDEKIKRDTEAFNASFAAAKAQDDARHALHETMLADSRKQNEEALAKERDAFNAKYADAREAFDRLKRQLDLLEENVEDISFGVYKPHYDFATSAEYKSKLDDIFARQKQLIRSGGATHFANEWTINGSKAEGQKMQKQYSKLVLRAFNGECDSAIAKVTWNNVTRMEERIRKAFEAINELGGVMHISLEPKYLDLRIEELRLSFEAEDKKHAEVEEQRRIRSKMREEEKVQHELDEARRKAEADEEHYSRALEAARAEVGQASGAKLEHLNSKIEELQQQLAQAQLTKERAISQAQLTRSGHIYVVSNIGSFGEGVYKIGMTRRLDPHERIDELSDASVPFGFDVHGMIHSDDAPALEHEIHQHFEERQLNRINRKKEFFRISLSELDEFARSKNLKLELTLLAEAREYRQTRALVEQLAQALSKESLPKTTSPNSHSD